MLKKTKKPKKRIWLLSEDRLGLDEELLEKELREIEIRRILSTKFEKSIERKF